MNNIAIALIIFMLLSKKDSNYMQIFRSLSPSDIQMILEFLGINENLKNTILNLFPSLLDENFDLKNMLPSLLPLFLSSLNSTKNQTNCPPPNNFSEIDGLANEQIKECLKNYFV